MTCSILVSKLKDGRCHFSHICDVPIFPFYTCSIWTVNLLIILIFLNEFAGAKIMHRREINEWFGNTDILML